MTIILTTHYLEEAEALADRICILENGTLKALGTAEALKMQTHSATFEDAFLAICDGEAGVKRAVCLSFAISNAENIVRKAKPKTMSPGAKC